MLADVWMLDKSEFPGEPKQLLMSSLSRIGETYRKPDPRTIRELVVSTNDDVKGENCSRSWQAWKRRGTKQSEQGLQETEQAYVSLLPDTDAVGTHEFGTCVCLR